MGDVAIALRAERRLAPVESPMDTLAAKRRMLAEFIRMIGEDAPKAPPPLAPTPGAIDASSVPDAPHLAMVNSLPPRLRQTLAGLLRGDSEKQVARSLEISPHTVHVYVKSLYRKFNVASRGELLAKWVTTGPAPLK